jgi:transposase
MIKLLMLLAATVLLGACSGVPERTPTHRWEGQPSISHLEYRRDNSTCESRSGFYTQGARASAAFADYQDCMSTAGYKLVGL